MWQKKKKRESIILHITSLEKVNIQNWTFLLNAYCFCTIVKLKIFKFWVITIQTVSV